MAATRRADLDTTADCERFRLRGFVDDLVAAGEVEIVDEPTPLSRLAARLDGNPRTVLFRRAGPEGAEVVGNVMGSRARVARAFGTDERGLTAEFRRRLADPIPPVEVPASAAPVQAVVKTGDDADLTALPAHLQHDADGAPYISASLDFARDPQHGGTNVGIRRMMLRGRREAGVDLNAPSDLRAIYGRAREDSDRIPVAFAIGAHPADYVAAMAQMPPMDEYAILGALRGAPVPVVRAVTCDLLVPADAEYVLEGYFDARGWVEPEGPYGEYVGYYGRLKRNPVFHLTAVTHRRDALFQTMTISGRTLALTDTAQLSGLRTELSVWQALESAIREPVAVHATPACGGMYNVRISMRPRYPGEARNAIAAAFGSTADAKHVFVVDDDIDVFSHDQMDWALATRFQADRDLVVSSGYRAVPLDPSLGGARTGAKAGFDLTMPPGAREREYAVPEPPVYRQVPRRTAAEALAAGPQTFRALMEAAGSDDGREIVREIESLAAAGRIERDDDGRYRLKTG
ncbi:MAG: UbiD family decarboxylase [Rhodospirillales bacterium]